MVNAATVVQTINKQFSGVQDLGDGILRGERQYGGKTFATAYIDISDHVVERADDLASFQERLLGNDFFKADGDQRWNSYLYFWAGPNSRQNENFPKAKARIEGDRHFARKFVLSEDELLIRLGGVDSHTSVAHVSDDASVRWGELLLAASLGIVLEQRPRTQILELMGSGEAFVAETSPISKSAPSRGDDPLNTGLLRNFRVGKFRSTISGRNFSFGDVNLIFGQNGAGKTSLLESIEALYCGRIRRDPSAVFGEIEGEVATSNGALVKVKSTTTASIIKARNLNWYGRSSQQSSAISHSFTRYNFLDTDAAFRLASETNAEQIKEDLSLLLVGPEASTLWTYLTKLRDETLSKRAGADERVPFILKQTELLGNEVKRLQQSPTESTATAKTYRSGLRALGAKWDLGEDAASVNHADRTRLESLSRGFRQAIAAAQSTPATVQLLVGRSQLIAETLTTLHSVVNEYGAVRRDIIAVETRIGEYEASLHSLQHWTSYCEAGAPALSEARSKALAAVAVARTAISGVTVDEVQVLSAEYSTRPLQDALEAASANLELAMQQERSGVESLHQRERLGQSIVALRGDLRDVVTSLIERTGDSSHCPVCMTVHSEHELLHKIEALTSSEALSNTDGLRQAIQTARERLQREKGSLASLKSLERFASANASPSTMPAGDIRDQVTARHRELSVLNDKLSELESEANSLSLLGIDWSRYDEVYGAAAATLGSEKDIASLDTLNSRSASLRADIAKANESASRLRARQIALTNQAIQAVTSAGIPNNQTASLTDLVTTVERASAMYKASLEFIQDASQLIELTNDKTFENIQLLLDQVIADFDRAQHAERNEVVAQTDLHKKTEELQQATEQLRDISSRREYFEKASDVLSRIVQEHSLEKATQDALDSIRDHVSDIFARIHAPAEYVLGDFQGEALLSTRDGRLAHGAHQVSTGQRSALALSIFLALNRSAVSAPPVMLIDDPVAHIDDLNALSFLDYLRDLAVGTRKQIFFATADAKLAALFQKKFEFLGDRYKKIVLSR